MAEFKFFENKDSGLSDRFSEQPSPRRESAFRAESDLRGRAIAQVLGVPGHERLQPPARERTAAAPVAAGKPVKADRSGSSLALPDEGLHSTPSRPDAKIGTTRELGELVRRARKATGFSQQQLADLAGVGRRFVSELEAGKPTLEIERILSCCEALGIDISARRRS